MSITIYALVDPRNEEVRYIGQAVDVLPTTKNSTVLPTYPLMPGGGI